MSYELLKEKTILYVEDDLYTREEVALLLRKTVKKLYTAENGSEGLELYKKYSPDLVITDIQMPVMNGLDMIEGIKKINKNVPVVVTTAFNETDYLLSAINIGVNSYLLKPINLKKMIKALTELVASLKDSVLFQILDKDGNILDVNKAWLEFLGYEREEVIGKAFAEFASDEYKGAVETHLEILKKSGMLNNFRLQLERSDGAPVDFILNSTSVYSLDRNFEETRCELRNIEYYMNSEEQIIKMLDRERYLKSMLATQALISKAITGATSINTFYQNVCNAFTGNVDYEFAFLAMLEEDNILKISAQSHHKKLNMIELIGDAIELNFHEPKCPTSQAIVNKSIVIIDDIAKLQTFHIKDELQAIGINAIVSLPIYNKISERDLGVLTLMFKNAHVFGKEEIELFESIAESIAFGIQAIQDRVEKERLLKELNYLATTDDLTGIANRRKGIASLEEEVVRSHRYKRPLSLIFFDIDHFKAINDKYLHETGDDVLVSVAKSIQKLIRSTDMCVRWGGEEFIIVVTESDIVSATQIANKVRARIGEIDIVSGLKVTASFGIAQLRDGETWEEFVGRADKLMYKAKDMGRDRVISELEDGTKA